MKPFLLFLGLAWLRTRWTSIYIAPCLLPIVLSVPLMLFSSHSRALGAAPGDIAAIVVGMRGEVEAYVNVSEENEWWEEVPLGRKWVSAQKGIVLRLDDRIRTGGSGRARIQFYDYDPDCIQRRIEDAKPPSWLPEPGLESLAQGFFAVGVRMIWGLTNLPPYCVMYPTVFNLGDNTEVGIEDYDVDFSEFEKSSTVRLIEGVIGVNVGDWPPNWKHSFSLTMGTTMVGVRGTEFTASYDPREEVVKVDVTDGEVVLTGPGGSRIIKAGESAVMVNGEFPGEGPT